MARVAAVLMMPALVAAKNISEICIHNSAGFAVKIYMKNSDMPDAAPENTPDMYPAGQTRCVTGSNLDRFPHDGDLVYCLTTAVAGATQPCLQKHTYEYSSSRRAHYECTGATFTYNCEFKGYEDIIGQCTMNDTIVFAKHLEVDYEDDMKSCGLRCLGTSGCVRDCMMEKEGYSKPCASCMGDVQGCTVFSCPLCAIQSKEECNACVYKNCQQVFQDCTGFGSMTSLTSQKHVVV